MKRNIYIISIIFGFFVTLISINKSSASCSITGGVIDNGFLTDAGNDFSCFTAPDLYEIVAYEMYLCSSAPTAPNVTTAADLTNCTKVWENTSGNTISITQGGSFDMSGSISRPANGTYTHGVMLLNNTFGITISAEFSASMTGSDGTTGAYCASKEVDTTFRAQPEGGSIIPAGGTSTCADSAPTAGKTTETLLTFDFGAFNATAIANNINGTNSDVTGYLIDSDSKLASEGSDVNQLLGVVSFDPSITFTDSTTSLDMSMNVGEGMTLANNGSNQLFIGSGPFQSLISVD